MQAASPLAESTDRGTSPIGHHTNNNTVSTATAVSVPHTHSTATSSTSTPSATTPSLSPSLSSSSSPQKRRLTRSPTPFSLQDLEDQEDDEEKFNTTTTTASMFRRNNMYTENTSSPAPVVSLQSIMSQRSTLIRPFGSSSPSSSSSFSTESSNTNNNAFFSFTNHSGQRNYTYLSNSNNNTSGSNDVKGHEGHLSAPKNTTTITSNNSNNNIKSNSNTSNDYKKPTAGWTLFAALAKMSPEEVELIRLTKANTAANKQITTALVSSTTTIDSESVESIPTKPFLKSSPSPKRARQRRKAMSLSPPSAVSTLSFEMMNDDRQGEGEKEYQQEDMYSGDNSSPDLIRSPSSPNERGSLSSSSSSSSLSSPPSSSLSSSQSPSPGSSPTHRRKRSKIDSPSQPPSALLSRRNKSSSSPKAVQIDESKNIVFSYQAGSTIVSLKSLASGGLPKNGTEVYGDDEHKMGLVHKNEKNTARSTFDTTASTSSPPSSSSSPSSSPWWSWSSAMSSSQSSQSASLDKISPSSIQSWTPEAPGSLDSTASDNGPNTFMNIASSLDRLWSPPMLRRTFSEVSSARRGSRTSASTAAGTNESGLPRVPMLRRQASMPSLEREMSDDNPFIDQPAWNPSSSQEQPLQAKAAEASQNKLTSGSVDATPTLPAQEPANTVSNECQEVVMMEAPPMVQIDGPQTSGFTSTTTTTTGSHKNSRGVIRRRDNRQQHHPYRRRAPTSTSTSASQSSHGFALPAQLRRAASFSGSTNTPAQPVLRREMSTTAYMDIM
ncbi:hypothetical protein BGX29_003111 [Mortierella sp. GBA35]|nr:hypothetical protein BGX29_003111 [Mortierella sp. GBA35]